MWFQPRRTADRELDRFEAPLCAASRTTMILRPAAALIGTKRLRLAAVPESPAARKKCEAPASEVNILATTMAILMSALDQHSPLKTERRCEGRDQIISIAIGVHRQCDRWSASDGASSRGILPAMPKMLHCSAGHSRCLLHGFRLSVVVAATSL